VAFLFLVVAVDDSVTFFGVATENVFLLVNQMMLTLLDESFSVTVLNGQILHGISLHPVLEYRDF